MGDADGCGLPASRVHRRRGCFGILGRLRDHGRTYGVEFDVAGAGDRVLLAVDEGGLETAFPQRETNLMRLSTNKAHQNVTA